MSTNLLPDKEHLIAQRCGSELRILSNFSAEKNILLRFIEGNMIAAFLNKDKTIEDFDSGTVFHYGWDDLAPWMFGDYAMIGANHGSPFAFRVNTQRHWCFTEDIGKVFTDQNGNEFVLVAVENLASLIFHSRGVAENGTIKFAGSIAGNLTAADKKVVVPQSVNRIQLPNFDHSVLTIHNRYNSQTVLADGKELAEKAIVKCSVLKMVLDMDLCPPDALCGYLIEHPGRYVAPNAPELASLLHTDLVYTFLPDNTMCADANIEFLQDVDQHILYGLLQFYGDKFFEVQEKFVPKLKPFDQPDFFHTKRIVDLGKIWRFQPGNNITKTFTAQDCCNADDPPCRYIDFFGSEEERQLGVVLGYSRLRGISAAGNAPRQGINMMLPTTGKIYPYILNLAQAEKGEKFAISAYRQFFQPVKEFNGAMFGHYENEDYCFYADCAEGGAYTLQLPGEFAGKSFEVIEKYGRVELPENQLLDAQAAVKVKFADRSGLMIKVKNLLYKGIR